MGRDIQPKPDKFINRYRKNNDESYIKEQKRYGDNICNLNRYFIAAHICPKYVSPTSLGCLVNGLYIF